MLASWPTRGPRSPNTSSTCRSGTSPAARGRRSYGRRCAGAIDRPASHACLTSLFVTAQLPSALAVRDRPLTARERRAIHEYEVKNRRAQKLRRRAVSEAGRVHYLLCVAALGLLGHRGRGEGREGEIGSASSGRAPWPTHSYTLAPSGVQAGCWEAVGWCLHAEDELRGPRNFIDAHPCPCGVGPPCGRSRSEYRSGALQIDDPDDPDSRVYSDVAQRTLQRRRAVTAHEEARRARIRQLQVPVETHGFDPLSFDPRTQAHDKVCVQQRCVGGALLGRTALWEGRCWEGPLCGRGAAWEGRCLGGALLAEPLCGKDPSPCFAPRGQCFLSLHTTWRTAHPAPPALSLSRQLWTSKGRVAHTQRRRRGDREGDVAPRPSTGRTEHLRYQDTRGRHFNVVTGAELPGPPPPSQ